MASTSPPYSGARAAKGGVRHFQLRLSPGDCRYIPRYFVEARVEFSDVRSGLRESCGISLALETCPLESDALWTKDMVWLLDAGSLAAGAPPEDRMACTPPALTAESSRTLESKIVGFIIRHYTKTLFRNFTLNLYSRSGESKADFAARCAELLGEQFRRELDRHREVFERKLDRIRERHLGTDFDMEFDRARLRSQIGSRIHDTAERVTGLFLKASLLPDRRSSPTGHPDQKLPELEEKLQAIEMEAGQAIDRVRSVFQERAWNSDEYLVRPTLRDIHLGRLGFVWMPVGGGP
jgi:hypothetical protein